MTDRKTVAYGDSSSEKTGGKSNFENHAEISEFNVNMRNKPSPEEKDDNHYQQDVMRTPDRRWKKQGGIRKQRE